MGVGATIGTDTGAGRMKTHIGHYEIVAILGRGGMGVVYKGYEPGLARFVAIKELAPALAHDPALVERFLREARSMAALNDPRILQIHFIGEDGGQPYFAMEFVDGESLASAIKRERRLHPGDALKILLQAAQGLAVAHEHGVIHRDVKPANLLLTQRGQVKIADFGIALANQEFDSKLTGTGQLVGTPGYLSPEVCLGKPVDARSDIFALGIVLFEMLAGHMPFSDESPFKLMLEVVQLEIPDVRGLNQDVDADVAAMLAKMLAKDPADRYQTMRALIADLHKQPLAHGDGLSFKTVPEVNSAATQMLPATPGAARPPTPLPGQVATPHSSTRPGTPVPAAAVVAAPAAPTARSRWPIWAGLATLLVIGLAFAFRGSWLPTPASVAAAPVSVPAAPATIAPVLVATPTPPVVEAPKPKPKPAPSEPVASSDEEASNDAPFFVQQPTLAANLRNRAQDAPIGARAGVHRVAVVGTGDPVLAEPAKRLVEQQLRSSGANVVDSPGQADIVVRVNAEVMASREMPIFNGASTTATSSLLTIQAFGAAGRPIGPGVRQTIEYTEGDVEGKLAQMMSASSGRIAEFLRR